MAYLFKEEFENAQIEFELFLQTVEHPKCIADLMTGEISVQFSYYYLGYIYHKLGRLKIAIEYFAKCNDLTDKLMLGDNLVPIRLGVEL
jgi:tetratricopeptide (TPR) repeat protein